MTEKLEKQQKLEQEKKRRQKHQVIFSVKVSNGCRPPLHVSEVDDGEAGESFICLMPCSPNQFLFRVAHMFSLAFLCFLQIPGISQQHPATRKRL